MCLAGTVRPDLPAGDPGSGVAGRLGGKIIRAGMDDDSFADDVMDRETIRQKYLQGIPVVSEKGREVSCVEGVFFFCGIVMGQRIRKGIGFVSAALTAAVDVESKDVSGQRGGKPPDLGCGKNAPGRLVKINKPVNTGMIAAAGDPCLCLRAALQGREKGMKFCIVSKHDIHLPGHRIFFYVMPSGGLRCAERSIEKYVYIKMWAVL